MDPKDDGGSSSEEKYNPGPTEEELEDDVEMHEPLAEMEKEKEEKELQRWLAEWKVLTDAGETWLREQGYTDEVVHIECFEEVMPGEEVDSDVETVQLPDEDTEEDEDEDDDEDDGDGGGYGGGGHGGDGGGGGSGWGGSGGGTTGG